MRFPFLWDEPAHRSADPGSGDRHEIGIPIANRIGESGGYHSREFVSPLAQRGGKIEGIWRADSDAQILSIAEDLDILPDCSQIDAGYAFRFVKTAAHSCLPCPPEHLRTIYSSCFPLCSPDSFLSDLMSVQYFAPEKDLLNYEPAN